jgi:hypothetical protein
MRKMFALATMTGIALAVPLAAATSAMADDQPAITLGDGACVAPWYWEGPLDVATNVDGYKGCDGPAAPMHQGSLLSLLDGACLAPWHWKGPGNVLTGLLNGSPAAASQYQACNGGDPATPPGPPVGQPSGAPCNPAPPVTPPAPPCAPGADGGPSAGPADLLSPVTGLIPA